MVLLLLPRATAPAAREVGETIITIAIQEVQGHKELLSSNTRMADTFKHIVRNFSGGLLEDKRVQSPAHFSVTKHFDTFTYPQKLVPYAQTITALGLSGADVKPLNIVKFAYAPAVSGYHLIGFGVDQSNSANVTLYSLDIDNAANGTAANALDFVAVAQAFGGSYGRNTNVFFYYKSWVYFFDNGLHLQKLDPTGLSGGNANVASISFSNVCQPVHHPLDDIAYFFADNVVYSLNNTSWNGAVLTLPSNEIITCATAHGNYLAVGTITTGKFITSKVYLWDRDSSLTTVTDVVDFGEGQIRYLASLNNKLIGVVDYYTSNFYSIGKAKMIVKEQSGEFAVDLNTITTDTTTSQNPNTSFVKNNKLYFPMIAELDGDLRQGIWCVDSNGKIALDTIEPAIIPGGFIDGIFSVANIWFIAHSENGSVTHTDAAGTYSSSNPSVYETLIFSTVNVTNRGTIIMNAATTKKLVGVAITHEPLTAGQSITLSHRCDVNINDATQWKTIFTNSTVGTANHFAINYEADGQSNFPTYNEIQFRIESLGGAVFTGLEYEGEVIDNGLF